MFDWFKDKLGGSTTRISEFPWQITKGCIAVASCYMASVFSFPFYHMTREMVEFWPKENGVCRFGGNYRKAAVWLWYFEFGSNVFPGFFTNHFYKTFPQMFLTLWIADTMGMFTYWNHDYMIGAGSNTYEESFT